MTTWGKAGQRLGETAADIERRRQKAARDRASIARWLEVAREGWAAGHVRPYLITRHLDMCGLEGPEVDIACGAAEPDVDDWEAGWSYPTFEQLQLLAKLCGVLPHAFIKADVRDEPRVVTLASLGSLAWHMPPEHVASIVGTPVVRYWAPAALRAHGIEPGLAPIN